MTAPIEGSPRPIKARVLRPSSTILMKVESPLDETGFFKDGKIHDNIHNAVTCGCPNCQVKARTEAVRGGLLREGEVEMTIFRYQDVANQAHQVKIRG